MRFGRHPLALCSAPHAQEEELADMAEEAAISRLYGGIHFRSDNEVGLTLGRRVGQVAIEAYHVPST
jgi:hypothetical protein